MKFDSVLRLNAINNQNGSSFGAKRFFIRIRIKVFVFGLKKLKIEMESEQQSQRNEETGVENQVDENLNEENV